MGTIRGTDNDDVLNGEYNAWNQIFGYDGNDILNGSIGTDQLYGGDGDDTLNGGAGNDELAGHDGADFYNGGDGYDTARLYVRGADSFVIDLKGVSTGGEFAGDTFSTDIEKFYIKDGTADQSVLVKGYDTADDIVITSSDSDFTIKGGGGNDTLFAMSSVYGDVGAVTFFGAAGADVMEIQDSRNAALYGGTGNDILELFESSGKIFGGKGHDRITVDNYGYGGFPGGETTLYGGGGNDIMTAHSGSYADHRTMYGEAGNDTLTGGTGQDDLYGGIGRDVLTMRRDDGIIDGGAGNDIINLSASLSGVFDRYVKLNIDGGKGSDTLNIEFLPMGSTVVVNYDISKVIIDTPTDTGFEFSFSNIETFIATNATLTFIGSDASAPIVEDDNLESKAEKVVTTKFQDGTNITITDSLGGGDNFDVWGAFARTSGVMSLTSYRQGDSDSAVTYSFKIEKGANTFYITPPDNWDGRQGYLLAMAFSTTKTPKEAAIQGFINSEFAGIFKNTVIDLDEVGAKLFKVMYDNVDQLNASALMDGIAGKLGFAGKLIDFTVKTDTIHAAFQISHQQGLRQSYIEIIDLLAGMAASSVGGFAGVVTGGPVGSVLGGFLSGMAYGLTLSNTVKRGAGDDFDILYFNQTGTNSSPIPGAAATTPFDPADLVFDQDWYAANHPDAVDAVQGGEYPSYIAYFLKVGIKAGHSPNATAPALTQADLALNLKAYDPATTFHTAIWSEDVDNMVGDNLSAGEHAMSDALNDRRITDANIDAGLSAVANRVARDWVLNQTSQMAVAGFVGGVSDWVKYLSNGKIFAETFGDLPGLNAGLDDSIRILATFSSRTNINKIADFLVAEGYNADLLLGEDTQSLGIAEYGGLWVILVDSNPNADDGATGIAVPKVKMTGTNENDVVYAGLGVADVDLGAGHDIFVGGTRNDKARGDGGDDTLKGGRGKDRLTGNQGNDTLKGEDGDDVLKGGEGNDQMTGGKGHDDFVFGGNFGKDIITDFNALSSQEDINLKAVKAIRSFADLSAHHMVQIGDDVVITAGNNSITLKGIDISDLNAGDFLF